MVTTFLTKDTADYCLRTLAGDFSIDTSTESSDDFRRAFIKVCQSIILDQAEQQQTLAIASALAASGGTFGPDACSEALKTFWKPAGIFNTENQARIEAAMSDLGIGVSLAFLINAKELADERKRVGAALGLPACR